MHKTLANARLLIFILLFHLLSGRFEYTLLGGSSRSRQQLLGWFTFGLFPQWWQTFHFFISQRHKYFLYYMLRHWNEVICNQRKCIHPNMSTSLKKYLILTEMCWPCRYLQIIFPIAVYPDSNATVAQNFKHYKQGNYSDHTHVITPTKNSMFPKDAGWPNRVKHRDAISQHE